MIDLGIYRHRVVRDLAWALAAPPLLQPRHRGVFWPPAAWYQARYAEYAPVLALLDLDPGTLQQWIDGHATGRLGSYFEALLGFWLSTTPRFRLLAHNVAVRDGGRTIGEFDLLAGEPAAGRTWHIEAAVKFYLGLPGVSGGARAHWRGVDPADRLDIRVDHLRRRQSRLAAHPAAQQILAPLGIRPDGVLALVKGRLFYPHAERHSGYRGPAGLCSASPHGTWYTPDEFAATFGSTAIRWLAPPKRAWLSVHLPGDGVGGAMDAGELIALAAQHPVHAVGLHRGVEVQRCFVVPAGWPRG